MVQERLCGFFAQASLQGKCEKLGQLHVHDQAKTQLKIYMPPRSERKQNSSLCYGWTDVIPWKA